MNYQIQILRLPQVKDLSGLSRSCIYQHAANGTYPPPVKLAAKAAGWPRHEVEAMNRARIAGKSDAEIRALVKRLVAERAAA